jgi:hypothetical protein
MADLPLLKQQKQQNRMSTTAGAGGLDMEQSNDPLPRHAGESGGIPRRCPAVRWQPMRKPGLLFSSRNRRPARAGVFPGCADSTLGKIHFHQGTTDIKYRRNSEPKPTGMRRFGRTR